nr:DUF1330 domain-containing protein [Rhodospirillales bacterium]
MVGLYGAGRPSQPPKGNARWPSRHRADGLAGPRTVRENVRITAYLIANIAVTDPAGFQHDRERVGSVIAQFGGRHIVRGGAVQPLAGALGLKRLIVLEFPSVEAARRCYDSREYAPLLQLRLATARSHVALVEGYAPV